MTGRPPQHIVERIRQERTRREARAKEAREREQAEREAHARAASGIKLRFSATVPAAPSPPQPKPPPKPDIPLRADPRDLAAFAAMFPEEARSPNIMRAQSVVAPAPAAPTIAQLTAAALSSKGGRRLSEFWKKVAPHMDDKVTREGPFPTLGSARDFALGIGNLDGRAVERGIKNHFPHWYVRETPP
jgi:hypothetical protein